tara:strand:+ start:30 stop:1907 length:1878 start_codon:yes stop_codon:yes gene_type:complete
MATYRELIGKKIKKVSSDPSAGLDGEMWYNSTTGTLRGPAILKAWISASPTINTYDQNGGCGTQTAALTGAGSNKTSMEEYNGTGWTAGGAVPAAQELQSQLAGTQSAAIMKSGLHAPSAPPRYNTQAYTYDGSSWSSIPAAPGNRVRGAAVGTQTAFLCAGGASGPPTFTNRLATSVEYNGSSWTAGGALSTARAYLAGLGTEPAAIMAGGAVPPSYTGTNLTEQYDGSSFSSLPNLNTARHGLSGAGTTTANVVFGGGAGPPYEDKTESYDGSSWTVQPTMGTGRTYLAGAGATSTAAVAMAGYGPAGGATSVVEEFNISTNAITAAAWASATSLTRNMGEHIGGAGSSADGLAFGGEGPANYEYTEEWNGSSWTNGGDWPLKAESIMGCGLTGTTALGFGGIGNAPGSPPVTRQTTSATYDGSSWTTTNSLPTAKRAGQGFGVQTSAVCMGGDTSPTATQNTVEEWDGTNWTAVPNAPFAKGNMGGGTGTLTAGLVFGGADPSTTGATYEYDGTNWTSSGSLITARVTVNGFGGPAGQTASICAGGAGPGGVLASTEGYDGSVWSTRPSLGTARQGSANGIGTSQTAGVQAGGATPSYVATVEEFTGETSTANIKDFEATQS